MQTKNFGTTGLRISEIGFGGSRIGGVFAGKSGSREARNVLAKALDSGITFYDTADMYAQGESESLIGSTFRGYRDQVVIATKGGFRLPARREFIKRIKPLVRPLVQALGIKRARLPSGASGALSQDFSPAYLAGALEGSLKRLRTDYVDLYQLHSPGSSFMQSNAFGETLDALERFKTQGKIRFYGIATEVPEEAQVCVATPGISSLQIGFGLLDLQALEHGTLANAGKRGLGIIARGCYGGGLLKDGLSEEELKAITPKWERILALRAFSAGKSRSTMDMALQFCRSTPQVSVTLLGMRLESHLHDGLQYANGEALDAGDYRALRQLHAAPVAEHLDSP